MRQINNFNKNRKELLELLKQKKVNQCFELKPPIPVLLYSPSSPESEPEHAHVTLVRLKEDKTHGYAIGLTDVIKDKCICINQLQDGNVFLQIKQALLDKNKHFTIPED